jgi:hypothetical protein
MPPNLDSIEYIRFNGHVHKMHLRGNVLKVRMEISGMVFASARDIFEIQFAVNGICVLVTRYLEGFSRNMLTHICKIRSWYKAG